MIMLSLILIILLIISCSVTIFYRNKYNKLKNLVEALDVAFRNWKLPEREIHGIFDKLNKLFGDR